MALEIRTGAYGSTVGEMQRLVDEAASFHLLVTPSRARGGFIGTARQGVVGFETSQAVHRLRLSLEMPTARGLKGANDVGACVGDVIFRWVMVEREYVAQAGRPSPGAELDRSQSQRFVIEDAEFRFTTGDGFRAFGAGRTFPIADARGMPRLIAGGVGDVIEGAGCFANRRGNFTLAGEITVGGAFSGEVMVRVLDPDATLRSDEVAPLSGTGPIEEGISYLTWVAQKGGGPDQENSFSISPSGQPRGLNIPVQLKRVWTDFSTSGGFRAQRLRTGEVIGREIGFGKEARPRAPEMGTPSNPYQFEGVSLYSFYDNERTVATLTANVLEGRSIRVQLPGVPDAPALRFGYFGPIVTGSGLFEDVRGMLYGTAGSVFAPPPAPHIITNLYVARLFDPDGRWRTTAAASRAATSRAALVSASSLTADEEE
jgi:hypothetical protein